MRKIITLIYLFIVSSCNQSKQPKIESGLKTKRSDLASALIACDFLKYADNSNIEGLKLELSKDFNFYNEENFRIAHIDAEELAEFNFEMFLPSLQRILTKRNFQLQAKKLNDDEYSNDILINGDTLELYSSEDLNDEIFWETASRNFFRKLNEIIRSCNIDEQFYLLYGGNDLHSILLTDKQFSIIAEYYRENKQERPYIP